MSADPVDPRPREPGPAELAAAPVLESGAVFRGLVTFRGGATVDGRVEGDVIARGTLRLGPDGQILGRVEVDEAILAGRVEGVVRARRRVELAPSAVILGDVEAPLVAVAEGGRLSGRCRSGPSPTVAG